MDIQSENELANFDVFSYCIPFEYNTIKSNIDRATMKRERERKDDIMSASDVRFLNTIK